MLKFSCIFFLILVSSFANGQQRISSEQELLSILSGKDELVDDVLSNREQYRLQLVYTPVLSPEGRLGETLNLTTGDYFYPASTVKLPTALLALEKLKRLGLSADHVLKLNSDVDCGSSTFVELSQRRDISFKEMISELLVVSDNNYYNSLYHFLSPAEINKRLMEKGYVDSKIYRAFTGCEVSEHLTCNSYTINDSRGNSVYEDSICVLPSIDFEQRYSFDASLLIGKKHENKEGVIVDGPFDFNYNLEIPLTELHNMLMRLVFPNQFPLSERWDIHETDRLFLLKLLGMYPRELKNPKYKNRERYPDLIYKYLMIGEGNPKAIRTISKIGLSYGFTTETAFVIGADGKGYFLSVSMYTNANDVVNDGKYEYNELARPFLSRIGKILFEHR